MMLCQLALCLEDCVTASTVNRHGVLTMQMLPIVVLVYFAEALQADRCDAYLTRAIFSHPGPAQAPVALYFHGRHLK
jgi:hypothetical protein